MTCAFEYIDVGLEPARRPLPVRWMFGLEYPLGLGETLPVGRI
jgi:hypothetical protein